MSEPYEWLLSQTSPLREKVRHRLSIKMDQGEKNDFAYLWEYLARPEQLPPPGDWRVWMIMAGRGFGKTRSGAEWVRMIADANPRARIALVSSSLAEARAVMVEGESGLLGVCRPGYKPLYEPSLHRLRFRNGAQAQLFSAAEPESLRGPQHSHASGTGAKGVLRKPVPLPPRRAPDAHGQGIPIRTARRSGRRGELPDQGTRVRGLDGAGGSRCGAHRRRLALHRACPGDGIVRSGCRSSDSFPVGLASGSGPSLAIRRHDRRCGSPDRHKRPHCCPEGYRNSGGLDASNAHRAKAAPNKLRHSCNTRPPLTACLGNR